MLDKEHAGLTTPITQKGKNLIPDIHFRKVTQPALYLNTYEYLTMETLITDLLYVVRLPTPLLIHDTTTTS